MSAVTTANAVSPVNFADVKADPVLWAKKGNKIVYGDVRELKVDINRNIRFRNGAEFFGVKCETDTYDIPSMKQGIVDGGGILEPILVSVRGDGSHVPLRGNRRTISGQELANDPTITQELFKHLTERTPMIILTGLSDVQEQELVNDQTQKPFLRSEVVRHIFLLREQKYTFERIAALYWETLGKFSGNAKKIAEVRDTTDPMAKRAKIVTWLRGTLDNYLIWGYDLGPIVRKCIMLSTMATDGLLKDNAEKPYFNTEKNSQKRIAALRKAKEADGSRWNGLVAVEGSEFKKVLDKFHSEDYGTQPASTSTTPAKMRARKDIEGVKDSYQSKLAKDLFTWILGGESPTLTASDDYCALAETKAMLVEQFLPNLKPEVQAIMRLAFVNPDLKDFQEFLESNVAQQVQEQPAA